MANKAQDELQSLLDMQGEAQDAQANLAKLEDARTKFIARGGDEADFALPEALATGIGAAWLLGPAGILLGVAQGILGKKEQQNAIDAYNSEVQAMSATNDIFNDELDRLALTVTNPNDLEQLSSLQTQKDAAMQMIQSGSPELMDKGRAMFEQFSTGLNEYTVRQEEQRISVEAMDAQMQRELGQEKYARHRSLLGDFHAESSEFEAQQATANNILQSLNNGDGASVTAALATLPLLVNPEAGATTEAEVEIWQKIGGTFDGLRGRVEKELGTGGLTDATRREIIDVTHQYKRNSIAFQQAREARYGDAVGVEEIPQKYWSQYNLSGTLPVVQEGGFVRSETLKEEETAGVDDLASEGVGKVKGAITGAVDRASMAINDKIDDYRHTKAWKDEFFRIHGQYPADETGGRLR